MKIKKIFAIFCLLVILLQSASPCVWATEEKKILIALGDSISAGYGLSDVKNQCFVNNIFGKEVRVVNKSVSGNKAVDIIEQLNNEKNPCYISASEIQKADFITITCGGNDMMEVLYERVAQIWNESNPTDSVTPDEVPEQLAKMNIGFLLLLMNLLNPSSSSFLMNDKSFETALEDYAENILKITSYINEINPSVAIVVATQYNPYNEFEGGVYDVVYRGIEEGVIKLNNVIKTKSKEGGYSVSDVKKAFDEYSGDEDLYNADISTMNVDFHPTSYGHKVIAESFRKTIDGLVFVKYYVCHYYEALDETFVEEKSQFNAVSGKKIKAIPENKEGFTLVEGAKDEITEAEVGSDTVFKLYYSRNTYKIGWHSHDDIEFESYKFGEKITAPTPLRKGYKFREWDREVPETMPSYDMTIIARWDKKSKAPVIIVCVLIVAAGITVWMFLDPMKSEKKEKRTKVREEKLLKKLEKQNEIVLEDNVKEQYKKYKEINEKLKNKKRNKK